jgi:hypothetical protein
MQPPRLQYVLAHTFGIVTGTSALLVAALFTKLLWSQLVSPGTITWLVFVQLIALMLGWVLGLLVLAMFGPLVLRFILRIKGGPFQSGEWVYILSGSHRDRIVRIYQLWDERGQVRVDLGEQAKQDFTDVFSCLAICRASEPEHRLNAASSGNDCLPSTES